MIRRDNDIDGATTAPTKQEDGQDTASLQRWGKHTDSQRLSMGKLEPADFPNRHLDCYEASLICILRYLGLPEETPLMAGAHTYFVFDEDNLNVWPRSRSIQYDWRRIHGLEVETCPVTCEAGLRGQLKDKLDAGLPVCLPVDIYFLPHTNHYRRLHLVHHLDVFGYSEDQYYIVSPYYRFQGWMDAAVLHSSVFSPVNSRRCLMSVPELRWKTLLAEQVQDLVRQSCEYMLGLAVPEGLVDRPSQRVGLAGLLSFVALLSELSVRREKNLQTKLLVLSTQVTAVGYSRYWFHRLVQSHQAHLGTPQVMGDLNRLLSAVASSWMAVGMRFGAAVHARDYGVMEQVTCRIDRLYGQEHQLFNCLLGALPDYEKGCL